MSKKSNLSSIEFIEPIGKLCNVSMVKINKIYDDGTIIPNVCMRKSEYDLLDFILHLKRVHNIPGHKIDQLLKRIEEDHINIKSLSLIK